jgi:hypothetical protein
MSKRGKKYCKKNKTRKPKKIIGGTLEELKKINPSEKVIILIGDKHIRLSLTNSKEFNDIVQKQKNIIDIVNSKFNNSAHVYSELPRELMSNGLSNKTVSSNLVIQYVLHDAKMPLKFSNVSFCMRNKKGDCNEEYGDDILSIFQDKPTVNCVVAIMGFSHLPDIKKYINSKNPDIKIIFINTMSRYHSDEAFAAYLQESDKYLEQIELLMREPPYDTELSMSNSASSTAPLTSFLTSPPTPPSAASEKRPSTEESLLVESAFERVNKLLSEPAKPAYSSGVQSSDGTYIVEVLYNDSGKKIYKCPICNAKSGTYAPQHPYNTSHFTHFRGCPNQGKIPVEQ